MTAPMTADDLRKQIRQLVGQYAEAQFAPRPFVRGETVIPPAGKVIGAPEIELMVEASLDGWLTTGRFNTEFEAGLAKLLGAPYVLTTTSGSSANLLALSCLTSHKLGDRRLKPGDEVITVAAGFPTTVNPSIQHGLIPVFVDVDVPTYNIDASLIEAAITEKTGAIMIAHTLGNPFDLAEVRRICDEHDLWLVEDCCDALGATFLDARTGAHKNVGLWGDVATVSFYPAHHITMGEGGAVFTQSLELRPIIESIRDWGRDCYCAPGCDNTCGSRFGQQHGTLPFGYDHKYVYSHLGYNLKITDMQAACGLAQLDRAEGFVATRRRNFDLLTQRLKGMEEIFILPEATPDSNPSWFGYPLMLRDGVDAKRVDVTRFLDQNKIGTRLLFAGNLTRQPYFQHVDYRVVGDLTQTDRVMNNTFWLGLFPALGQEHFDYVGEKLEEFFGLNF
ncbi:lipopolysaccharide biosynthesis protein RfbH [Sphingomonas sp. Leaf231]|uniref:lipopolysaccharide biosynthesis protein RfbH n=1 Tax=Sphingomonas sp. Leaf231 TaxID=1736301 RepID=UPI000AB4960D|nr:lipopolysaccharide biosynthesis protein RfbH [Sphingomonas sp. Leaf231]